MQWFQSKAMVGALALATIALAPAGLSAQSGFHQTPVDIDDSGKGNPGRLAHGLQ